jgi:hypothetical protein
LTGRVDAIGVSGDYQESNNLIAGITVNMFKAMGGMMMCSSGKEN